MPNDFDRPVSPENTDAIVQKIKSGQANFGGGPIYDMPPIVHCETCMGAEYVRHDVPVEHEDFGKLFPCPGCKSPEARRRKKMIGDSGMEEFRSVTFDNPDCAPYPEHEQQFRRARQWVQAQLPPILWLWGGNGQGKTMIAWCIGNALLDQGVQVVFREIFTLLDEVRATMSEDSIVKFPERWKAFLDTEVIIIDEFGKEAETKWVNERVFYLLDYRYKRGLPTVITTNLAPMDFKRDVTSRIQDASKVALVQFEGGNNG